MGEGSEEFLPNTVQQVHETSPNKLPISSSTPEEPSASETHFDKAKFTALCQTVDSIYGRHNLWETKPGKIYKAVRYIGDRRELSDERLKRLMDTLRSEADLLKHALHTDKYFTPTLGMMNLLMAASEEKHAHQLSEFAASFAQENLPYIETALRETDDKDKIGRSINAGWNMANFGNKAQSELGIDFLLRNFEPSLQRLKDTRLFGYKLETIFYKGNDMQVNAASHLARRLLKDEDPDIRKFTSEEISNLVGSDGLYYEPIRKLAKDILEEYEIDYNTVVKAWADSGPSRNFIKIVDKNLRMIFELESQRPGIVKTLINDYKIYDLARYPTEMLVEQYDQRDNKDLPYGIVIYPRSDWNGVFYDGKKVFQELFTQLKEKGYGLRVFEVGSMYDVARSLIKSDQRYGENHKISFAIVGGHGTWDSIEFGSDSEPFNIFNIDRQIKTSRDYLLLKQRDLKGSGAQRSIEFFEPNPTIILTSCTTGTNRGVAQEISRLGAKVIGPEEPTSFEKIQVTNRDTGRLNFKVDYGRPFFGGYLGRKPGRTYASGQKE